MGVPGGIDVCTVPEQELGDLESMIQARPGESSIEHLLRGRGRPAGIQTGGSLPLPRVGGAAGQAG
jgi:hypothetical protein